jgi:hypothetical protein
MTSRTGANTSIGLQVATTWGTAVAAGVGDKWEVDNLTVSENASVLTANPIGSGSDMMNAVDKGVINPTISGTCNSQFQGPSMKWLAALFGQASGPFATADAGAKTHSLTYASERTKYLTIGFHSSSATSVEVPTLLPTKASFSCDNVPNYEKMSFEGLGNAVQAGVTNTAAALLTTTFESTKRVVPDAMDYFRINAQGGAALGAGDNVAIVSYQIGYDSPLENVPEISGAASLSNGIPRKSGTPPFATTLSVTLRANQDNTYLTAALAGTEYKAEITAVGDLIGTGVYYTKRHLFPRLKLIQSPDNPISNAGENPVTLNFEVIEAAAVPTGMIDTKPSVVLTNALTTNLLA